MAFSEWSNNKKKKKNNSSSPKKASSFSEYSNAKLGITEDEDDIAPVAKRNERREEDENENLSFKDLTVNSFMRGRYNSMLGQESYKQMSGQKNNKEYYENKLNEDEYSFVADKWYEKMLSGASEQLGQWYEQYTDPKAIGGGTAAATSALLLGQAGPQIAAPEEIITVPGAAIAGFTAGAIATGYEVEAGLAYNELIENGISHKTASSVALGVGLVNTALEMWQIDELVESFKILNKSSATKGIAKKTAEYLKKRGINVATETSQEVMQEGITIAGTQLGSKIDKGEFAYDGKEIGNRLLDTAEQSALTFAGLGIGGDVVSYSGNKVANKVTNAIESKPTETESKVIDKVVENEISKREADGNKLTNKEKNKIYDDVVKQMEKGYLSIDSIEEALGGETYTEYKKAMDENTSLKKELDELNDIKASELTGKQSDRLAELKAMNLNDTSKIDELKNKMSDNVFNLVKSDRKGKGSFLMESYNEVARGKQAFEVDLTKYTGKRKEAVERALNSGVLNNTNRTHDFVDFVSYIEAEKGISFDYTNNAKLKESGFAVEGKRINGFVKDGVITVNMQSKKAWESVVGHEITHVLEGTEAYGELQKVLYAYAESKGELASRKATLTELYTGMDADIDAELTADLVGDYLFADADFINHLTGNRTLFQKIYDEIKYLCKVATGKELTEIEKVKREFDKVWNELSVKDTNENEATDTEVDDVQYSVSVEDKQTLDSLNEQVAKGEYDAETNPDGGYYVTYKSMSYWGEDENGNAILRSPMAEYVDGELSNAYLIPKDKSKLNWYQATETIDENTGLPSGLMVKTKKEGNKTFTYLPASENQDLINNDWSNLYFNLQKKVLKNGKWVKSDVPARYNPYEHSSNSMLNDQFSAAYLRDNLVTVKMYVPISEDNGAFRAKYSKDATGWADWKTGTVAGKIGKQKDLQRKVYLSRYAAPVEIVPDSEVAQAYKGYLEGTDVAIPDNVVSPNLLKELKNAGVPIEESGKVKYSISSDSEGNQLSKEQQNYFKDSKVVDENGNLKVMYHGSQNLGFTVFDPNASDDNKSFFFSDKPSVAASYSDTENEIAPYEGEKTSGLYKTYLNLKNPYVVDANGAKWNNIVEFSEGDEFLSDIGAYMGIIRSMDSSLTVEDFLDTVRGDIVGATEYAVNELYVDEDTEESHFTPEEQKQLFELAERINNTYVEWDEDAHIDEDGESTDFESYVRQNYTVKTTRKIANEAYKKGYDGVIFKNVVDVGKFANMAQQNYDVSTVAVAFDSSQIKSVDNAKPTSDPDIRFSLSNSVEETKDLVAVHNLREDKLLKSLNLGGLPMPSIAIVRAKEGHNNFGNISLVFGKKTIDPKLSRSNKVYSADGWTPTYPQIEYKLNTSAQEEIESKINNLVPSDIQKGLGGLYLDAYNLEHTLNRSSDIVSTYKNNYAMKYAFLRDSGVDLTLPMKNASLSRTGRLSDESIIEVAETFSEDELLDILNGDDPYKYEPDIRNIAAEGIRKKYRDKPHIAEALMPKEELSLSKLREYAESALNYKINGIQQEIDYKEATTLINDSTDTAKYDLWLKKLFSNIVAKEGIRNDKDLFTPSGNRRSFEALHYEHTLENVIKAMKEAGTIGIGGFGGNNIMGASVVEYDSIEQIKEKANERMTSLSQDEYDKIREGFTDRFLELASSLPIHKDSFSAVDDAANMLCEAVMKYKTKSGMANYLRNESKGWANYSDHIVDDLVELVDDIRNMPASYFEAKPQRAVGFDEVATAIIPDNASDELKAKLAENNIPFVEYESGNEQARLDALNSLEDAKFSLSNANEEIAPVGTPLKDLYLEQDVAPVRADIISDTPNNVRNTPTSERIANGERSDELLYESLDNYPMQTIEQKIAEKIRALQGEIADKKDLRREQWEDYESRIATLREKYNSKKNKNTKEANKILQSISRLERLKASSEADYAKRISDLEARVEKMSSPEYSRAMFKHIKMKAKAQWAADLLGDTSTWKDKKLGLQYAINTERRNLREIVRDENGDADIAHADEIYDALMGEYNRNHAELNRKDNEISQKYLDMKINRAESVYANMLGELRHNPETTLTEKDVNEYYEKHKEKIDTKKVDRVIELVRSDLDWLIETANEKLREQGMKEIAYRKGYFPHGTFPKQNFIQKLLNWKTQDTEIPTSIAGLTEGFKPVKSYQSFDKQRHTDVTDYDIMRLFEQYKNGALDWIYHIEDIQKRRAVENHIRYTHSEEGIKAKIEEVYANEDYDADEAQAEIEKILAEANNPLNNFVQDFMTHTNILANKKNSYDRAMEQGLNRKIYSVMQNVQNRTSANLVLANVRSALTNIIPITQSWAQVSPLRSLQATKDTIANAIKDDGLINKSTFLTNRLKQADKLYQTNWDKVLDKAGIMFEVIDNFSSQVIWRSKYNQNIDNGMTEAEAIANADQFAENVMAGRSKGNEPTLFNAKNPLVKAFTMFQLEVNNEYGYFFKDVPNDLKAETNHWKLNLAKGYATAFIGAYVYNALLEKVAGSGAALDPIGIIEDLLKDLGLFDDDEEEKEPGKALSNFAENVAQELPFVGGLLGGGRIPISSAIPYSSEYSGGVKQAIEDVTKTFGAFGDTIMGDFDEADWSGAKNIGKELMNPLLNVGLPVGGGQIKKTYQGLNMFSDDHPVTGSYTDSGNLRFPVEDTPLNRVQAAIFGQYASENAREYFDNGYAPLKEKQIQEYQDVDIPIKDYWEYRKGLAKQDKLEDKLDYIAGLDLPVSKKNILANNVTDRKNKVDLENWDDYDSLEEFDFAANYPGKYALAKSVGGYSEYKTYSKKLNGIKSDKDAYGKSISGSRKEKVLNYINNLDADYETKLILFKSEYPSDDTYNMEIIDYLNNRSDISYDEMVAILKELGFTVTSDGMIYWE
jgi:hypothetical protein